MTDFFVGFRPSPKMPEGLVPFRSRHTVSWSESPGAVFNFLTQPEYVDQWLAPTQKFDARQGGKLRFSGEDGEEFGGTYSRISVPRKVVLQIELHGELDFTLREVGEHGEVDLVASRLGKPEEKETWQARINKVVQVLGSLRS
jgi:uncharacterized protein YndB with AHSA1/START domain